MNDRCHYQAVSAVVDFSAMVALKHLFNLNKLNDYSKLIKTRKDAIKVFLFDK